MSKPTDRAAHAHLKRTSLLNASARPLRRTPLRGRYGARLCAAVTARERVVSCEEVFELRKYLPTVDKRGREAQVSHSRSRAISLTYRTVR